MEFGIYFFNPQGVLRTSHTWYHHITTYNRGQIMSNLSFGFPCGCSSKVLIAHQVQIQRPRSDTLSPESDELRSPVMMIPTRLGKTCKAHVQASGIMDVVFGFMLERRIKSNFFFNKRCDHGMRVVALWSLDSGDQATISSTAPTLCPGFDLSA